MADFIQQRSRLSWDKNAPEATDTRTRGSSSTQARPTDPPGDPGKQRRKQTAPALVQELRQMSVRGQTSQQPPGGGGGGSPVQARQSSRAGPGRPRGGLASVARLVKLGRCRNVVVVAGAGISTASGIPDFRTPGTGLYANLEQYKLPYPEAVFSIDYFSDDPLPFFSLAKALYPGHHRPNYIHYFVRMLHHKGLLLRVYTQNIDGLERLCGIPEDKLVEAHGSFRTASCHLCYTSYPAAEAQAAIMSDQVPVCSFCAATVKPDVVFFGEDLPQKYFLHAEDFPKADLLIIMGTSLQIEPFASLVNTVRSTVPRLLLNRHAVGPFQRVPLRRGDHMELGDLEVTVRRLAQMLGWSGEIEELMSTQETQSVPVLASSRGSPRETETEAPREESDSESDSKSSASSTLSS